jgi:hypothetical protein
MRAAQWSKGVVLMKKLFLSFALGLLFSHPGSAAEIEGVWFSQPISIGVVQQDFDFSLIRGANAGWVRVTFVWRDINPAYGTWNWSLADGIVNNARAQGLKILAVLSTAPVWAGSDSNGAKPPANIAYWEEFVRRVAQRYAGRIEAYEIWNEPDLQDSKDAGIGWDADLWASPRYVDYVRAAAIQIRANAAGALVVAPGTSSAPGARTVEVFKQLEQVVFPDGPASKFMDVVSFHGNAGDISTSTVLSRIDSHLSTLAARNPSNLRKPIWLTEFGWRVEGNTTEANQRDKIRTVIENLTGSGGYLPGCGLCTPPPAVKYSQYKWTHVFIYKDVDSSSEKSGLYRIDHTRKPVITDYLATLPFPAKHPNDRYTPFTASCVGRTCTFSTPASDPYIALTYRWDFGDGAVGHGQTVSHTYSAVGQYFVVSGVDNPDLGPQYSNIQWLRVN